MGRQYKNPPLVEVACQFRFEPGEAWDWTVAARVYDKVKATYPERQQVSVSPDEMEELEGEYQEADFLRLNFLREDGSAHISIGSNFLGVSHKQPYPGWDVFREMIAEAVRVYREVCNPKGLWHVSLGYVNFLQVLESEPDLSDYLTIIPDFPGGEGQALNAWTQSLDLRLENPKATLTVQSGTRWDWHLEERKPRLSLVLDLECVTLKAPALEESGDWLQEAHDAIEKIFEDCVTDQTRALFDVPPSKTQEVQNDEDTST